MLSLLLKKESARDISRGYPWIWRGMIAMNSELETTEPGSLVRILDHRANLLGIGYFNPGTILAGRILSLHPGTVINQEFFYKLFERALQKRQKIFDKPFYRLVHSEGDNLPGLVIDRFGDIIVCQASTAGMENLKPLWLEAIKNLLNPTCVIFRNDIPSRKREGLPLLTSVEPPSPPDIVQVLEHNCLYYANLCEGQKTGWFYDQRANRQYCAGLSAGKNILDLYSHSGGFGLAAARGGATNVTMVDSSKLALSLAEKAAELNSVKQQCTFICAEAYEYLGNCIRDKQYFDMVMADPPAFIKDRKYIMAGLKGYGKLAFLCASITGMGGIFCISSCSHHASETALLRAVEQGITKAGRKFKLLHKAGADKDHPVHALLPESKYLKFIAYILT